MISSARLAGRLTPPPPSRAARAATGRRHGRQVVLHHAGGAGQRAVAQQGLQPGGDRRPERLQGAAHRGGPLRGAAQPAHRQEPQSVVLIQRRRVEPV